MSRTMLFDGMVVFLVLDDTENSVPSFLVQLKHKERPADAGRVEVRVVQGTNPKRLSLYAEDLRRRTHVGAIYLHYR